MADFMTYPQLDSLIHAWLPYGDHKLQLEWRNFGVRVVRGNITMSSRDPNITGTVLARDGTYTLLPCQ